MNLLLLRDALVHAPEPMDRQHGCWAAAGSCGSVRQEV
jgi:hypothetical protein